MTYADISDVTARLGRAATDDENTLITTRLADAERLILKRIPDLADQIAADPPTIDEADVVQVEAEAVLRIVRNPNGYVSETDGEYTYQLGQSSTPGALEIMPSEWELILGSRTVGMMQIVPKLNVPCHRELSWRVGLSSNYARMSDFLRRSTSSRHFVEGRRVVQNVRPGDSPDCDPLNLFAVIGASACPRRTG